MFSVILHPSARKSLRKLDRRDQERIAEEISVLARDPFIGKKLEGKYDGNYSVRVWPYRIVYTIQKKNLIVYVVVIGHRQGVYK